MCSNSLKSESENTASVAAEAGTAAARIRCCCGRRKRRGCPAATLSPWIARSFRRGDHRAIEAEPLIELRREEVTAIPDDGIAIVATGPLTSDALAQDIARLTGSDRLFFYDSISPIVDADTIDREQVFAASRYGKSIDGTDDYLNCPLNKAQYEQFVDALLSAESATAHIPDDIRCSKARRPSSRRVCRSRNWRAAGARRCASAR